MTKYARKNQLKHAETQGNKEQIAPGETGSRKMTKQFEKKHLKQFKNQSQSGRSMIEMLGVLAIIAVLSIGGIVGYRLAMNYYQANQIAHEMNMMRTDAQIKIAQGTEKLMLGEPYDPISESTLGHIQFNDAYPVDFACALANDETVELSNISCHVANAYYIELQNIPEGVCKPLAELVNGMNNIIAFDVNKNEYPETGKCEAGNENVLNAVFSAESVSELKVCKEDTDCESESTPHCDPSRHVCVRCYEDSQCEHNQYCEDNTCKSCDEGLVWNGEECVECTEDGDCADSDTPVCYTDTNTCVECLTYENCIDTPETPQCDKASHTCKSCIDIDSEKPVWADTQCVQCVNSTDCETTLVCRENTCSLCETEDECKEKGTNYHCSKDSTCIQCLDNQVWDDESKECVECTEDNDCTDTPDTPKCNTTTNQCVECIESTNCSAELVCRENTCSLCETEDECQEKGTDYHCSKEEKCIQCPSNLVWGGQDKGCVECVTYEDCTDTPDTPNCNTGINKCEACPKNSFWDGTKCAPGCKVNANCENGNYCHLGESSSTTEQTGVGSCQSVAAELKHSKMLDGTMYYGSENNMTWFDACHLCAARANYADDTKCNKPLNWSPTNYMADYGIVKCTDKETNASATNLGWGGNRPYCIVSDRTKDLRELFGFEREKPVVVQIWMGNARSNAGAYDYRTNDAFLHDNSRNDPPNGGHALCH